MTFFIILITLLIASVGKLALSVDKYHSVTGVEYSPQPSDQFHHFGGWGSINMNE